MKSSSVWTFLAKISSDKIVKTFQDEYAAVEEEIGLIWFKVLKETQKFQVSPASIKSYSVSSPHTQTTSDQLQALEAECEKGRDKQQLNGLIAFRGGCTGRSLIFHIPFPSVRE